jgi:hypothetical protein
MNSFHMIYLYTLSLLVINFDAPYVLDIMQVVVQRWLLNQQCPMCNPVACSQTRQIYKALPLI